MNNKRIAFLGILLLVVIGAIFFIRPKKQEAPLRICTWSNYYNEDTLRDFTQKTGLKVELSYISSNEELFAKLKAGATGYDLIQPSDYMVRQMAKQGMLAPLDHALIPNLSHIEDFFKDLPFDPGLKYSVPFTWGTSGIAVNTEKVNVPGDVASWRLLLESPDLRHTSLLDDMREVFTAVLFWKGQSPSTSEVGVLEKAKDDIARLRGRILTFSSEPKALLLKGEINVAHIYSTDGINASHENPKIRYYIPKEGAILWTDNFAIPKTSARAREAHQFINYFLDPDVAYQMAMTNHLATPNKTAKTKLPKQELENPNQYPSLEVMKKLHLLDDGESTMTLLNRMWTELKSS